MNKEMDRISKPIRVLCVFSTLDRGGAETMCMNLYRHIDKARVQFDFVKHTPAKGMFEDEIKALGGIIFEAPRYKVYNHIIYVNWWKHFLKEHMEYKIIHGHWFTISAVYFRIAHKFGCKTIGHSHATDNVLHHGLVQTIMYFINKLYLKRIKTEADYCFACSQDAGKWLFEKKPFIVLNNAVDSIQFSYNTDRRDTIRTALGIRPNEKAIFVVANLSEVKNPLGTLDIYKSIKNVIPEARLFWVGEGSMYGLMEEKCKRDNIEGVVLLGTRSDVSDLLQAADTFMLCSFSEGLPVVTIEAQAAGLPCLLSDAITREAAITDLCTFLPIDKVELWVDTAKEAFLKPRRDTRSEIIHAGYDIEGTSNWLTDFYLSVIAE